MPWDWNQKDSEGLPRILARGLSDSLGSERNLSNFCRKILKPGDPEEASWAGLHGDLKEFQRSKRIANSPVISNTHLGPDPREARASLGLHLQKQASMWGLLESGLSPIPSSTSAAVKKQGRSSDHWVHQLFPHCALHDWDQNVYLKHHFPS